MSDIRYCIICGREFRPADHETVICPACGGPPEAPAREQPHGTVVMDEAQVISSPASQAPRPQGMKQAEPRYCIICGNEFRSTDPEAVICPACGGPPEAPAPEQPQGTVVMDNAPVIATPSGQPAPSPISGRSFTAEDGVPEEWKVGDVILNLYEVKHIFETGGMGLVYRVHHRQWNTDLAVKSPRAEIFQTEAQKEAFIGEAETWIDLGLHPHIVTCYYVRTLGGIPRLFAEFVEGGSLKDWIRDRPLYEGGEREALRRILDVAIQFAWGLGYAHEKGLVHQDVKPANALMTPDGTLKVTDFGLARSKGYTPAYAAPEQILGKEVEARTDLWGWGLSLLEMFTGEVTWGAGDAAASVLEDYLAELPADLPRMPQEVAELLRQCFQNDPERRPPDMETAAERLMAVYQQEFDEAYPRQKPQALELRADSLNNRAVSYLDLGREEEAVRCWQEALQIDPAHLEANFNYGYYRWQRAEIPGSRFLEEFQALEERHQSRPEYWSMLGWIYIEQGNVEEIEKIREKINDEKLIGLIKKGEHPLVREIRTFSTPNPKRISFIPGSISLSANGKLGLSTSSDRKRIYVWDLTTGSRLFVLSDNAIVRSAIISPTGQYALTGDVEGSAVLWDIGTGQQILRLNAHRWDITSVEFSTDERYALTASLDGEIKFWDLHDGVVTHILSGLERQGGPHLALMNFERGTGQKYITSVEFSPNSQYVAASEGKNVYIWELSNKQIIQHLVHPGRDLSGRIEEAKFLPCGTKVLSACRDSLYLWDVKSGRLIQSWVGTTREISHVSISQDGRYAITTAPLDSTRLWDLGTRREICRLGRWHEVALSADGHWIFAEYPDDNVEKFGLWTIRFPENWKFGQGYPHLSRAQQAEQALLSQRYIHKVTRIAGDLIAKHRFNQAYKHLREAQQLEGYAHDKRLLDLISSCAGKGRCVGLREAWCIRAIEHKSTFVKVICLDNKYYILSKTYEEDKAHLWDLDSGLKIQVLETSGHSDKCGVSGNGEIIAFPDRATLILWNLRSLHRSGFETEEVGEWEAIALSYEGTKGLSLQKERQGFILDLQTGRELHHFPEDVWDIRSDAVHFGNRYLVCGTRNGRLQVRDPKTGHVIRSLTGHSKGISCVALSSDERWILSGSLDHTLCLWDVESGKQTRRFTGHRWVITSVMFSPNGRYALSSGGAFDSTIRLWDITTGREVRCLRGHHEIVECATFSPNGQYVLSGGSDKTVRLWDLQKGVEIVRLEGHTDAVTCVAFSPDGRYALSGGRDKSVRLWDLSAKKQLAEFHTRNPVMLCEFTSDGRNAIVSSGDELTIWDLRKRQAVSSWQSQGINIVAISKDKKQAFALIRDVGETIVCLWDLEAKQVLSKAKVGETTGEHITLSPDNEYGMIGTHRFVRLWNLTTQQEIAHLEMKWFTDGCISHDGHFVILADETDVYIWNVKEKQSGARFEHNSRVRYIALTSDNQFLISGCNDGNIYIWDIRAKKRSVLEGHTDPVESLSISPEGRYLVSCSNDRTIRIWALDWDYDFPDPADWDEGARPYLEIFITLHTPYGPDGLSRLGAPQWTEEDFQHLLKDLGYRGYGWLRPEGVRRELERMARERGWKGG